MVTRTASRPGTTARKTRKPAGARPARGAHVPAALHDAIEAERDTLAKAESLLGCLMISMEYETDPVSGPYYPHVAGIARELVRQSINGLDSYTLKQAILGGKVKDDTDPIGEGSYHALTMRGVPLPALSAIQ